MGHQPVRGGGGSRCYSGEEVGQGIWTAQSGGAAAGAVRPSPGLSGQRERGCKPPLLSRRSLAIRKRAMKIGKEQEGEGGDPVREGKQFPQRHTAGLDLNPTLFESFLSQHGENSSPDW